MEATPSMHLAQSLGDIVTIARLLRLTYQHPSINPIWLAASRLFPLSLHYKIVISLHCP